MDIHIPDELRYFPSNIETSLGVLFVNPARTGKWNNSNFWNVLILEKLKKMLKSYVHICQVYT